MLEIGKVSQITEIIDKGIESMEEDGYKAYYLRFVKWDDKDRHWVVGFYTEESNLDTVGIIVKFNQRGFTAAGRSYE